MTRRERLEAKVEKRREWAAGRTDKASAIRSYTDTFRGDWAFNTQPGHIPERARVIRAIDRAIEHGKMAAHHESKADGLEAALERTIYSDDANAVEALTSRIAELEAKRARMVAVNKAYRKGDARALENFGLTLESLHAALNAPGVMSWHKIPHPAYELSNLSGRIRAAKERIKAVTARTARAESAEAAGGMVIEGADYVAVTFAEKPDRSIIEALKSAGFHWSGGSWCGYRAKLPECLPHA